MKRGALLLLLLIACSTGRPKGGAPVPSLTASTAEESAQQLRARRENFHGMRSLMRVRATTNGQTQSFKAQLNVNDAQRMELTAYSPVGTVVFTMKANGSKITSKPEVSQSSFDFLRGEILPAEMAMLVLGLPPRDDVHVDVAAAGLASATVGNIAIAFDPPAFPAKHVIVTRGSDRIEIEHLEVVQ